MIGDFLKILNTDQHSMVSINHVQLQLETDDNSLRHSVRSHTSASILVNAFNMNNHMSSDFIASDLTSLTQHARYKLPYALIPKMTESNFNFINHYWQNDTNQMCTQKFKYQKILIVKKNVQRYQKSIVHKSLSVMSALFFLSELFPFFFRLMYLIVVFVYVYTMIMN